MRCGEAGLILIRKPETCLSICEHDVLQLKMDGKTNGEMVNLLIVNYQYLPPYYDKIKYTGPTPLCFDNNLVS